jgi:CHASE3 domain sensor protein
VIGLIVPFVCTLLVGCLQWQAVTVMINGRTLGRQYRNTQVALGVFRYSLSDAESAQFRYILTHTPGDIDRYRRLITQANDQFQLLRSLTAGNDLQASYLGQIEPLLKVKEANAELSFNRENAGDHAGALQIISSDDCRQRMLTIETAVDGMEAVAAQFVLQRQSISTRNLNVTAAASVCGLAINLVCIASILLLIRRLQRVQSTVTLDALREMINYEDGKLTIEEYLSRRATALSAHGKAQIEAERLIGQLERRKARRATVRVTPVQAPPP